MPGMITKRRLLSTGAGVGALSLVEGARAATKRHKSYDLIVIGAGNAGLPAAIFAADKGAHVLLIEAADQVGGTLFLSTGQMSACDTKLQKSKGIQDSPDIFYADIMRISKNTADPVLARLAVDNSGPTFDWITDHGLQVLPGHPETGTTHEPYSRRRYAWAKEGGLAILKVLRAQLQPHLDSGKVTLLTDTHATDLIQDAKGAVSGVKAKTGSEGEETYLARRVALTCGGYTYNPQMFAMVEKAPIWTDVTYPESLGAGVTLGLKAGGYLRGAQNHTPLFGAVLADTETPCPMRAMVRHFPGDRPPWEIYVGVDGKRFIQEDVLSHDVYEQGLARQPGERCWVVFDQAILDKAPTPVATPAIHAKWTPEDTVKAFDNGTPYFSKADTLEGLAQKAGFNADAFKATVADYNKAQASGDDPAFGRKYMPLPIAQGPFYAIELRSWVLTGATGLGVDGQLRVTRRDGTPIPNLYAAGELLGMGQLMGKAVLGGMSVTPALTFGRLIGEGAPVTA